MTFRTKQEITFKRHRPPNRRSPSTGINEDLSFEEFAVLHLAKNFNMPGGANHRSVQ